MDLCDRPHCATGFSYYWFVLPVLCQNLVITYVEHSFDVKMPPLASTFVVSRIESVLKKKKALFYSLPKRLFLDQRIKLCCLLS